MSHRHRLGAWEPGSTGYGRDYELAVHRTDSMLATLPCHGCGGQVLAGMPGVIATGAGARRAYHPSCAASAGIRA